MRAFLFAIAYWALSIVHVLAALPTLLLPGRRPTTIIIRSYARSIRIALRLLVGIKTEAKHKDRLPKDGAFIIAAKHQSWGDGFMVYPEIKDLVFVTGDHLERLPLVRGILHKLGAVVIDTCGGGERKATSLKAGMARVKQEGQRILIYPEGHLAPVDHKMRYKAGVWHMYKEMTVPVVPVATNLGLLWPQAQHRKNPGQAVIEFLEPILPGLEKSEFMSRLETAIETRTAELVAEVRGGSPVDAVQLPDPTKGQEARPEDAMPTAS